MARKLVLCCDGTNNQFDGHHTNVIRMYQVAERSDAQRTFYDPGVGTMPEPWFSTRLGKRWSMIKGLAFGDGFLDNITDAYRFLMENYQPGDEVYLFGFSRGAYTARAVAAVLHSVGLLHRGTENLIPYVLRYWQRDFGADSEGGKLCAEFKATLARPCPVHFIGVWDTVGSVGIINNFRRFPHTAHNPEVAIVRHAVSIDERRSCFRQNLMFPAREGQDIKNVWFAGCHSDVGGGHAPEEAGLAKVAFEWMVREARAAGMMINDTALQRELAKMGAAPIHESLRGGWWLVELIPVRRYSAADQQNRWHIFEFGKRRDPLRDAGEPSVYLHASVLDRLGKCPDYRPPNLPHEAAVLREKFKIEA